MKESELYTEFEPQKLVYYVEKEDSSYGPIISGSQLSANYLDDFFLKKRNLEEKLRKELMENKISPVAYYMTLLEMGPKDLASRLGVSYRKLQKILKPVHFNKLKVEKLKLLADIFNIPVANLFQTFLIKDEHRDKIELEQSITNNPFLGVTKITLK